MRPKPPAAKKKPQKLETHDHVREDPFFWLNRRDDPEVIAYLEAENAYAEEVMAHTEPLREALFEEIKNRVDPDESSVPYRRDDFYYYHRFESGKEYALHCRKRESLDAPETVLLDGNALAEGNDYFALKLAGVSPDHSRLAYATDTVGRRLYEIRFKNADGGDVYEEVLTETSGRVAWAADNETLFYVRKHPETLRPHRVYRHRLGTKPEDDVLVHDEADETFAVEVLETKSGEFILIASEQTVSSEYRFVASQTPELKPSLVAPREREHEYAVSHLGEHFYILTNWNARNFRLMRAPVRATAKEHWEEVIPHRDDVLLESFALFRDNLVLIERHEGLRRIRIRAWDGGSDHYVDFDEPAYYLFLSNNVELDATTLRFGYSSLTVPPSIYDYDMSSRERVLLKRERVMGGHDPERYRSEKLFAPARDGTRVPISLVYRTDSPLEGRAPLVLYGYGSYGINIEPTFSSARLSLLDRGFVFAIAHIRGSETLGRSWYEEGKLLKKRNTFTDFIDCAEFLREAGYGAPDAICAWGGSAGGLLVGAVLNERPEIFRAAVAEVPFVDVVTTMLDESIPLTTGEYDEWGNPGIKAYYDYMLSYSPYDNVKRQAYPHLLVTAGLHDSQVQYWEPAKWVAKLRELKTDENRLLLKTNMEAGHGGASGRFRRHRETAFAYAFLLDVLGRTESPTRSR